jgi:hypothetical protein
MMSCFVLPASAAETSKYTITFDNSSVSYMGPGEKGNVIVNVGTDRPGGNYTWLANITGGTVAPSSGTGSADRFTLVVTAPSTTGDLALTVTLSNGTASTSTAEKYTIHVVKPVAISAQVKNSGDVAMQNVSVQYKLDGTVVNTTSFSIPANTTRTLYYNWTGPALSNGEHTVELTLDPSNQFVNFINGDKVFTSKFFVGDSGWGFANLLLTIVFAVLLLVLFFTYMNKGRKKKT